MKSLADGAKRKIFVLDRNGRTTVYGFQYHFYEFLLFMSVVVDWLGYCEERGQENIYIIIMDREYTLRL